MRKLIVLAMWLALPSLGWAQCHGYSANAPQFTPLLPADAAQTGQVTATITEYANTSDSVPSHNMTVTPGTSIGFKFTSNNGASAMIYDSHDGNPPDYTAAWPLSGDSGWFWNFQSYHVGHVYQLIYVVTDANGNTTQDKVNITIVAGNGPSIVSQDAIFTNVYVQVLTTFGGGDMMDNCAICQQAPWQCIHATHTPYVTMTAVNHTSGESQSLPRQVAGNVAGATDAINGSGSILISALPTDDVSGTFNDEIICSVLGPFPVLNNDDFFLQVEWAWTKVSTVQNTCVEVPQMGGGVRCGVTYQYTCSQASQSPDLKPLTVFSNLPVGTDSSGKPVPVTPATMPPFWWTWGVGARPRVTGFPWFFPFTDLAAILQQSFFVTRILSGSFPSNSTIRDCTNFDKGTVPSPWPPFDQP